MVKAEVPTIEFNKEKREIRINGVLAGFIDGSKTMDYRTETDEHGLKIIVTETIELSSLPDGRNSITVPLMIFRPYCHIDKARKDREYAAARKAERDADARAKIAKWKARVAEMANNVEFTEGISGQAKIGGFL